MKRPELVLLVAIWEFIVRPLKYLASTFKVSLIHQDFTYNKFYNNSY